MRIAFITTSYPRFDGDGTAPFIKSIAETLVKSGHKVEIVAPYDPQVKSNNAGHLVPHYFRYTFDRWSIMGYGHSLDADIKLKPLVYFLLPFFLISAIVKLWQITGKQKSELIIILNYEGRVID